MESPCKSNLVLWLQKIIEVKYNSKIIVKKVLQSIGSVVLD